MQSSLGKSSALFSGRVTNALDVGSNSSKSPCLDVNKTKTPCKASSSEGAKKPAEGLSSANDNFDVNSAQAEVLQVSLDK